MFYKILFASLFYSLNAYANVVWPGLYLASRMVYLSIPVGLLIEGIILKLIIKKRWVYILYITLVINLISAFIGAAGALIGNLAWEFTGGQILYKLFDIGTFNPLSWSTAIIFGALASTVVESYSLKKIFKIKLNSNDQKTFLFIQVSGTASANRRSNEIYYFFNLSF